MGHCSALKRTDILKDFMLSKTVRHKRTNMARFHLYEILRIGKFIETDSGLEVTWGWEEVGMGS